jgi:hypothetical protein
MVVVGRVMVMGKGKEEQVMGLAMGWVMGWVAPQVL